MAQAKQIMGRNLFIWTSVTQKNITKPHLKLFHPLERALLRSIPLSNAIMLNPQGLSNRKGEKTNTRRKSLGPAETTSENWMQNKKTSKFLRLNLTQLKINSSKLIIASLRLYSRNPPSSNSARAILVWFGPFSYKYNISNGNNDMSKCMSVSSNFVMSLLCCWLQYLRENKTGQKQKN